MCFRYLRNPTGYLIVSLAFADLIGLQLRQWRQPAFYNLCGAILVGLVVMPLNSLFEMSQHVWLLGESGKQAAPRTRACRTFFFSGLAACDLFHALDILASTGSIWSLCVISLDRYLAGQDPIGYRDRVSKRRITIAIIAVWLMSACESSSADRSSDCSIFRPRNF